MTLDLSPRRQLRFAPGTNVALQQNGPHAFAARNAFMVLRRGAIYTHIPKNGCTTVRLSIAIDNGAIKSAADVSWVNQNNAAFVASLRDILTAKYTFVILRCPFSRLASAFVEKIVGRKAPFWRFDDAVGQTLDPEKISFREFVDVLEDHPHLDPHFRPQTNFLVYEDYDDWFAFERYSKIQDRLMERIGLALIDSRAHRGHGSDRFERVTDGAFADTPCAELAQMRRNGLTPAPHLFYDDGLVQTVARRFASDVAIYRERCGAQGLTFDV